MAVKQYLSRLLGIRHTTGAPTVLDCENLDMTNLGDATAATLAVSGALSAGSVSALVASEAQGDILRRGASGWERHVAKTSGQVLLGDGTDVVSTALAGDVTVNGSGTTAIGADKVLSAMISPLVMKYTKVAVSSAELLAINATPKTIIAAAAGYIHVIHRVVLVLNYVSAAYANNGLLGLYETNAAGTLLTGTTTLANFLAQTADRMVELHPHATAATTSLVRVDNKAVVLTQATGESITGDSPIDVHCWYSTIPHLL